MSELTSSKRHGGAGRTLLWLAILLSLLLLGFVTALSIRANPYVSNVQQGGISKFKFIEECKDQLSEAGKLPVNLGGQSTTLEQVLAQSRPLKAGEHILAELNAEPREVVRAAQVAQTGGWAMTTPVLLSVEGPQGSTPLGQLGLQCAHEKDSGKTVASILPPSQ
ncbi:hypothetical protein [Deinococcus hopiensis]|uniref:Uncharacterized protein n=1 Tax=Deinococcus hopiensis KR-140 TaxID=695939 RepID=A0A1W1VAV6_9DEIO|nr:hypothetical protein [Deinococcus hopiensis]SMB90353.1 hypothetical protein SAMN00790413_00739 [Deinococcus hopiensis KR-140]